MSCKRMGAYISIVVVLWILVGISFYKGAVSKRDELIDIYNESVAYFEAGEYDRAMIGFQKIGPGWGTKRAIGDRHDTTWYISETEKHIKYEDALKCYENGSYDTAAHLFAELGCFKDSEEMFLESVARLENKE